MKFEDYSNELSKLFEVIKRCTNIEANKYLIMLVMDKLLAFGNDENISTHLRTSKFSKMGSIRRKNSLY